MASKPLRPCKHTGCPELTREGWCPRHRPKHTRRTSAEYHSWYGKPIWTKRLRPEQLAREPFCRTCAAKYSPSDPRHRTRATVVDHVIPFRGDWELFVNPRNHQSLCKSCHDRKTAWEQAEERRKNGGFS